MYIYTYIYVIYTCMYKYRLHSRLLSSISTNLSTCLRAAALEASRSSGARRSRREVVLRDRRPAPAPAQGGRRSPSDSEPVSESARSWSSRARPPGSLPAEPCLTWSAQCAKASLFSRRDARRQRSQPAFARGSSRGPRGPCAAVEAAASYSGGRPLDPSRRRLEGSRGGHGRRQDGDSSLSSP